MNIRLLRTAVLSVLAILAAVSIFQGVRNAFTASQDFQWDAARALLMRLDPYELSNEPEEALQYPELARFYAMFTDQGLTQKMEANQFPSLLVLLFPVAIFRADTARILWVVLNLMFSAGIVILLRKTFFEDVPDYDQAVIFLLMFAGTPYRNQLGVGQHTLFAFFFFMLAVYVDKFRPFAATPANTVLTGLCLFVSYFKYTLTAPLALYFLYKKRYAAIAISVAPHLILTLAAASWLGKSFSYMIIAPLTVASALVAEGGIDLGVIFGGTAGMAVAFVIALLLAAGSFLMPDDRDYLLVPVLFLWSCILTYHRTYDFFVLSVVSMLFYGSLTEDFGPRIKNALMCWYAVLIAAVFFGLRIFSENTASKIVTGVIYYSFTMGVTILCFMMIKKTGKEKPCLHRS